MTVKEENETKKAYLNQYYNMTRKVNSLKEQQEDIRKDMECARAVEYSDMPKGTCKTDFADYVARLEAIDTKIAIIKSEMQLRKMDIEESIANMPDGVESDILRYRYIKCMHWEDICKKIGYSMMHTHRIHGSALQHFNLPTKML